MRKSTLTIAIRRTRALVYFRKPKLFNIFIISLSDQSDVKFHATFVSSDPLTEQIQMKNAFDNVMSLRIFVKIITLTFTVVSGGLPGVAVHERLSVRGGRVRVRVSIYRTAVREQHGIARFRAQSW